MDSRCGSMKEEEPDAGPQSVWEAIPESENGPGEAGESGSENSGESYATEPVPGIINEEQRTEDSSDIRNDTDGAAAPTGTRAAAERLDGDRFESIVTVEGMEEPVYYEYIVNDTIGIGMGYDYELFERRSQPDRECFVSIYDNSDPPEIYLEVTRSEENAETTAAAVIDSLSADSNVNRESATLDEAGTCIKLNADADKTGMMTMDHLHMIYIIPDGDECVVVWGHYTMESADGFGARFRGMINTIGVR